VLRAKGARYESQARRAVLRAKGARYESQGRRAVLRAKGARYESQGQARSEAERVAPGKQQLKIPALKGRNIPAYFGLSGLKSRWFIFTRGDVLRTCPWLSYLAPLARSRARRPWLLYRVYRAPLALCLDFFRQSTPKPINVSRLYLFVAEKPYGKTDEG